MRALVIALAVAACARPAPTGITPLPAGDARAVIALVGDADVVGLGESAHGSAGYARVQREVVQALVEHAGFRTVMLELLSDEDRLRDAYATCEPAALRAALYQQGWKDYHQERLDLHAWLCAYNQAHPDDPVAVRSFDPQKPWEDVRDLRAVAPAQVMTAITDSCFGAGHDAQNAWAFAPETTAYFRDRRLDPARHGTCMVALDALAAWLAARPAAPARDEAVNALASLRAWQDKSFRHFDDAPRALAIREAQMTANVRWRWSSDRRGPTKAIVIAHDLHVAKVPVPPSAKSPEWNGLVSLGVGLAAHFGHRYRAVAVTGYRVAAIFDQVYPEPTAPDSLELALHRRALAVAVVATAAPWIAGRTWRLHDEDEPTGRAYDVARAFDAVIFVDDSPAAAMLPKPE